MSRYSLLSEKQLEAVSGGNRTRAGVPVRINVTNQLNINVIVIAASYIGGDLTILPYQKNSN